MPVPARDPPVAKSSAEATRLPDQTPMPVMASSVATSPIRCAVLRCMSSASRFAKIFLRRFVIGALFFPLYPRAPRLATPDFLALRFCGRRILAKHCDILSFFAHCRPNVVLPLNFDLMRRAFIPASRKATALCQPHGGKASRRSVAACISFPSAGLKNPLVFFSRASCYTGASAGNKAFSRNKNARRSFYV